MSEQNRYRMEWNCNQNEQGWSGWYDDGVRKAADTWQDAIQKWIDDMWGKVDSYQVVSVTPSGDSRSGIIEIKEDPRQFDMAVKFKATLIED